MTMLQHRGEPQLAALGLQVVPPRVQVEVPERVADAGHVVVHLHGDARLGAVEDPRLQPLEGRPLVQRGGALVGVGVGVGAGVGVKVRVRLRVGARLGLALE